MCVEDIVHMMASNGDISARANATLMDSAKGKENVRPTIVRDLFSGENRITSHFNVNNHRVENIQSRRKTLGMARRSFHFFKSLKEGNTVLRRSLSLVGN